MSAPDITAAAFQKIDRDLGFLVGCFKEVLIDLGEAELATRLDELDASVPGAEGDLPARLGQAYSIMFQLLNMVEENAAVQARRAREKSQGLSAEPGLWGYWLKQLKALSLDERAVAAALRNVRVEPVL